MEIFDTLRSAKKKIMSTVSQYGSPQNMDAKQQLANLDREESEAARIAREEAEKRRKEKEWAEQEQRAKDSVGKKEGY
jgi:hypothetical protein